MASGRFPAALQLPGEAFQACAQPLGQFGRGQDMQQGACQAAGILGAGCAAQAEEQFGPAAAAGGALCHHGHQAARLQFLEMVAQVGGGHAEGARQLAGAGAAFGVQVIEYVLAGGLHESS